MHARNICLSSTLAILTAGCGGGSGEGVMFSAPAPAPTAVAAPTTTPTPTAKPAIRLTSDQPFATTYRVSSAVSAGAAVDVPQIEPSQPLEFRYDSGSNSYIIRLPGEDSGRLVPSFENGVNSTSSIVTASGPLPKAEVGLLYAPSRFSYSSWGDWTAETQRRTADGRPIQDNGVFAYGVPTAAGDVPKSGAATYAAELGGTATFRETGGETSQSIGGLAHFVFDFAQGKLSGSMEPYLGANGFQSYEGLLGQFEFRNTVFAPGATTFAGQFVGPGVNELASSFNGLFTGPQAAELIGQFSTPFQADMKNLNDGSTGVDHLAGTLTGIFVGKKD